MIRRVVASMSLICALGSVAQAQVKLEYKVPEGKIEQNKAAMKVHQIMTINGMDIETNADQGAILTSSYGTRKPDGTLPVEITLDSIKIKMGLPGGVEISLDSADKDAKIENPQLSFLVDMFKAMRGANYTVVLDAKNNVKFVEGTEKNLAKVGELPKAAADGLKMRFDPERIKREYEQFHHILPDGLVREGEPWERSETNEIGGGQTLTFKKQYEYKGTIKKGDKTFDKISVKALEVIYKMDPNAESAAKVTKSDLKVDSSEGTVLFDREAGTWVERLDKTRMKGDMTLSVNGMEIPIKLDLTLDSTMSIEKPAK